MKAMSHPAPTRVVEDYVTLIWKAHEWPDSSPSTTDLAAQLGVTPSTVSATLKKLARDGFIDYEPYGSITLTPAGRAVAVPIVRRHRLLETYLVAQLGLSWDQVHEEADRLEHAVSDLVLDRIDAVLGHPTHDPHGDPIPDKAGNVAATASSPLRDAQPGQRLVVVRVSDRSSEILRYLDQLGIEVGTVLEIIDASPAARAIQVRLGEATTQLSFAAAAAVRVQPG